MLPSSALNLSLWLSKRQCQVIFPLRGQAGETEALALVFKGWNIQSQMACFELIGNSASSTTVRYENKIKENVGCLRVELFFCCRVPRKGGLVDAW